ncbi:hypothetical protein ET475_08700 [Microbacterium protaetiae]|uniref:Uncharacterized protein n=1 Tax=Microbacterium protaetiae TaxID=2509458 RepID=A0A4P6EQ41_9MICO|nr:hypothetical protein ET475_08700 [Microbacterium protaetiae]
MPASPSPARAVARVSVVGRSSPSSPGSTSGGRAGMPRRYADYAPSDGFTWMNQVSTTGAMLLGSSMIHFLSIPRRRPCLCDRGHRAGLTHAHAPARI